MLWRVRGPWGRVWGLSSDVRCSLQWGRQVGDVDKAPSSLRGVVCAESARRAAFGAGLEYRRLPVANVAPVTSPLDELPEEWVEPPQVTSSDQVMTADARRRVRVWRRQLRRCFRAARRGELHRAWRLRPADL